MFHKCYNLDCSRVAIKKNSPGRSDGNKRLILFIHFLAPLLATRKKLLQPLHCLKIGFQEKIIQSKTFENTHVSPWENFCQCMK